MGIFAEYAPIYHDNFICVIPLKENAKRPAIGGWQEFCKIKPTDQQMQEWIDEFPNGNIGIPFGPANNIIGFDLDTDDEEVIRIVETHLPKSPIKRKGKKGYIAYYKYSGETNMSYPSKGPLFEILSTKRQGVLAGSIHPDTGKPYEYMKGSKTLLDFDLDDLPIIPYGVIDTIIKEIAKNKPQLIEANIKQTGGRNNFLKDIVLDRIRRNFTMEEIVRDLLLIDKQQHKDKALFLDQKEYPSFRYSKPEFAALQFASNIDKTMVNHKTARENSTEIHEKYPCLKNGFYLRDEKTGKETPQFKQFATYAANELKLVTDEGFGFYYRDGFYQNVGKVGLQHMVADATKGKTLSHPNHVDQFIKSAVTMSYKKYELLKPTTGKVNLDNGVLDVKTQQMSPPTPDIFFKYKLAHKYDPNAKCPKFLQFLDEVFMGDKEQVNVTAEIFGYCLMGGHQFLHKAFVLYGTGRNGKSAWINILRHLLGKVNTSGISLKGLDKPFSVVQLDGSLANITDETPNSQIDPEAFKAATASGVLTAAQKGKPEYDLQVDTRFIFASNKMPKFNESTEGLLGRLYFLYFMNYFPDAAHGRKNDVEAPIIHEEMSGVLNFALEGLKRLLDRGELPKIAVHMEKIEEFKMESDSVYEWAKESIEIDWLNEVKQTPNDLYQDYVVHCDRDGRHPMSKINFSRNFNKFLKDEVGPKKLTDVRKSNGRERYYLHVILTKPRYGVVHNSSSGIKW